MRAAEVHFFFLFLAAVWMLLAASAAGGSDISQVRTAPAPAEFQGVSIGPEVTDGRGRKGSLHRVVSGDTLWDISEAYLGTAWVWPSIWRENGEIVNPHRIYPGDTIWIARHEMRVLRADEVATLWKRAGEAASGSPLENRRNGDGAPGTLLGVPPNGGVGFVSEDELVAASSIVGSPEERIWLADPDRVFIGLGKDVVEKGDRFTIFRDPIAVADLESRKTIGYHVLVVGWLEVTEPASSSSVAEIRSSSSEIARGDRLMLRRDPLTRVMIRDHPGPALAGQIVFTPEMRSVMGTRDTVYLNRGKAHGLDSGVRVEIFDGGSTARDRVRSAPVRTPDHVVAELVVIRAWSESSAAIVTHTRRELEVGDHFRTASSSKVTGL